MSEQKKPEINHTILFLEKLKQRIKALNLKFDNPEQILNLRSKILFWYKKGTRESIERYQQRILSHDLQNDILVDSILMLWQTNTDGKWRYARERRQFLNNVERPRMLVEHLLNFRNRELGRIRNINKKNDVDNLPGLELLAESGPYRLLKATGTKEEKTKIFKEVTDDMGNCLGGVFLDYYLDRTDKFLEIYLIKEKDNTFKVAIEYSSSTKTVIQIATNGKELGRTSLIEIDKVFKPFLDLLLEFIRINRPIAINGIHHMEEKGIFKGRVITKDGEIKKRNETDENSILWPTPDFSKAENFHLNADKTNTETTDTLKSVKPKIDSFGKVLAAGVYIDANIDRIFLNHKESPVTTKFYTIQKRTYEEKILETLGIRIDSNRKINQDDFGKIWSLAEIKSLIDNQTNFTNNTPDDGPLTTEVIGNIFYIKDHDNILHMLHCKWRSGTNDWAITIYDTPVMWSLRGQKLFAREDI